jgi:hypothetical protein
VDVKHVYKVYRNGVYLGEIPKVKSFFHYAQLINTSSTDIRIRVDQSLDTSGEDPEPITDELGDPITTESGEIITLERSLQLLGNKDSGFLIANYNDVIVWEYSDDNPNGIIVFSGYISNWSSADQNGSMTDIYVTSYGQDTNQILVGTSIYNIQVDQLTQHAAIYILLSSPSQNVPTSYHYVYQVMSGHSFTLSKIGIKMAILKPGSTSGGNPIATSGPVHVRLRVINSLGVTLSTVNATIPYDPAYYYGAAVEIPFILSDPIVLSSTETYTIRLDTDDWIVVWLDTDEYTGGDVSAGFDDVTYFPLGAYDLLFGLYSGNTVTNATFTAQDPGTIVTTSVDSYRGQGGAINYTASSVSLAGYTLDYTFKVATLLEIIKKAKELSPGDFYWYVDPATSTLYFKQTAATATHNFILGRHIENIEVEASVEQITNVTYFSGGPTAGTNLFKKYVDATSLATNKIGMKRFTDNRVTSATTAETIARSYMDEFSDEIFRIQVRVLAKNYNISSIDLGETASIEGYNNFIDALILQITKVEREGDYIDLTLGKLPFRTDAYVDEIKRGLEDQQTLDNPSQPT